MLLSWLHPSDDLHLLPAGGPPGFGWASASPQRVANTFWAPRWTKAKQREPRKKGESCSCMKSLERHGENGHGRTNMDDRMVEVQVVFKYVPILYVSIVMWVGVALKNTHWAKLLPPDLSIDLLKQKATPARVRDHKLFVGPMVHTLEIYPHITCTLCIPESESHESHWESVNWEKEPSWRTAPELKDPAKRLPPPQPPAAFNKQLGDNSLFQWRKVPKRYHPITPISINIKK